jgi:ATP-dependent protease ClpP protease subunit
MQVIEKNINNVLNGVATIMLYDQIGTTYNADGSMNSGISGTAIAEQIQYLNEVEKVDKINIRINSVGGNVYEGYSIISAMLNSKAPCNTYVDGLAASIAGVIAVCGKQCCMMDYSTLMLHNPFGEGVSDDVLNYIKGTLVKIISNRCKRTQEEIAFMMDGETWLSASEALKMGFVDEVQSSAKEFKLEESNRKNLYNLVTIYNKLINEPITNQMTEQEKLALEAQVSEANAKVAALESEKTALEAKLIEIEEKEAAEKDAKITAESTALVENAIKEGKIKEEAKEPFIALAKKDFETVKNSLDAIVVTKTVQAAKILDKVATAAKSGEDRSGWNIRTWEKKAPKELANMYKNNSEEYDRMYNEYYKKSK